MPYIGVSPQFGVRRKHTYTATASQTSFSGAGAEGATLSYTDSNFVDVYQNGVKLGDADYTSTSGTAIVLGTGATVNDIIEIIVFDAFSAADTVSKTDGGQFDGNVTFAGTATFGGSVVGISSAADDITAGDAAVNLTTTAGNITIDAQGNDTDIIFKGTDNSSDITMLTLDGSEAGAATFNGVVTANAGVKVDNITIDGTEIDLSSGSLTVDSAANITLDCGTGELLFNNGGNGNLLKIQADSSNVNFIGMVQDKDLVFKGNDGGSTITALTLDMSDAGTASFNHDVKLVDNAQLTFGDSSDMQIFHDGSNSKIVDSGTGNLNIQADDFNVLNAAGDESKITASSNGAVQLLNDNSVKLATNGSGVTITGTCTATTFSGSGASLTSLPASGTFRTAVASAVQSGSISIGTNSTTVSAVSVTVADANDRVVVFAPTHLDTQSSSTSGQGLLSIFRGSTNLGNNAFLAESARLRWFNMLMAHDTPGAGTHTYSVQASKTNGSVTANGGGAYSFIIAFVETV